VNEEGNQPLYYLASLASVSFFYDPLRFFHIAMDMVCAGGDVNHQNRKGRTVFHELCSQANWTFCVCFLYLFPFIDVNCMDMNGETPLHVAVRANQPRLVEVMLDFGAYPDISGFLSLAISFFPLIFL